MLHLVIQALDIELGTEEPKSAAGGALYLTMWLHDDACASWNRKGKSVLWAQLNCEIWSLNDLRMEVVDSLKCVSNVQNDKTLFTITNYKPTQGSTSQILWGFAWFCPMSYTFQSICSCMLLSAVQFGIACLLAAAFPTGHAEELGPSLPGIALRIWQIRIRPWSEILKYSTWSQRVQLSPLETCHVCSLTIEPLAR